MPRNKKIYKQYDSRWGKLPYPTKSSSFSGNGCGAVSVLHCIIEMEKYKNWTPKDIQPYMKQFAVVNQGTTWSGIPTAMKHFGLKNVKELDSVKDLWKEMAKGNRVCVLLFSGGAGPDGTVWTGGGHYIGATDYRVKDGYHQLYMKDSGPRDHDGWYSYEKSMKGKVFKIWIGTLSKVIKEEPKVLDYYNGSYPVVQISTKAGSKTDIKNWQKFLNWWTDGEFFEKCGPADGIFGANTKSYTVEFQYANKLTTDGIVGTKTIAKAKKIGKSEKH